MQKPSSKIDQSVDVIRRRLMKSMQDVCIYKKLREWEWTYIYCTSVKNYLLNLLKNF